MHLHVIKTGRKCRNRRYCENVLSGLLSLTSPTVSAELVYLFFPFKQMQCMPSVHFTSFCLFNFSFSGVLERFNFWSVCMRPTVCRIMPLSTFTPLTACFLSFSTSEQLQNKMRVQWQSQKFAPNLKISGSPFR